MGTATIDGLTAVETRPSFLREGWSAIKSNSSSRIHPGRLEGRIREYPLDLRDRRSCIPFTHVSMSAELRQETRITLW